MKIFNVKSLFALSTLLLCVGFLSPVAQAASYTPISKIHKGMTYSQVQHEMGWPSSKRSFRHREEWWVYKQPMYLKQGYMPRFTNKVIIFKNGRVVSLMDEKASHGRRHHHHHGRHCHHHHFAQPFIPFPGPLFQLNLKI